MRIKREENSIKLWASSYDTYKWATKPNASWPCSQLSGKRFFAHFINGDLVDLTVNGRYGTDVDGTEFNAFIEDALGSVNPREEIERK